jgi:hypothetical protein
VSVDPDVHALLHWLERQDGTPAPRASLEEHLRLGVRPLENAIAAAKAEGWITYSSGGGSREGSPIYATQPGWVITESGARAGRRQP